MIPDNIKEIARKFLSGEATEQELSLLHQWYDRWEDDESIVEAGTESPDLIESRMLSRLLDQIRQKQSNPAELVALPVRKWWKLAVAAAVIIALGASLFIWKQQFSSKKDAGQLAMNDTSAVIRPGIDKALLVLDNGKELVLDDQATGIITQQGNTTITNQHGQLSYVGAASQQGNIYYNTVKTGRGNQYQLLLPDGTKVWLNASSSIRFATTFSEQERIVELTGEGYFEVAKDRKRPFKVMLPKNIGEEATNAVEVLGTNFNIMAYQDEAGIKTTLLEGSVKVGSHSSTPTQGTASSTILKPGQQAIMPFVNEQSGKLTDNNIRVTQADVDEAVAWKDGYFRFTDAPITAVMRQAARWYDVEVVYNGNVQQEVFSGSIPRTANIMQLIKILELTKTVKIRIEGRKLITSPY